MSSVIGYFRVTQAALEARCLGVLAALPASGTGLSRGGAEGIARTARGTAGPFAPNANLEGAPNAPGPTTSRVVRCFANGSTVDLSGFGWLRRAAACRAGGRTLAAAAIYSSSAHRTPAARVSRDNASRSTRARAREALIRLAQGRALSAQNPALAYTEEATAREARSSRWLRRNKMAVASLDPTAEHWETASAIAAAIYGGRLAS